MTTAISNEHGTDLLARLNRIPVWALPKMYLVIIGLGYFFTFYDISNIGFAMPAISKQFHLSHSTGLFLALAIGLIGYVVGSFAIGALADHYGRYRMLIFTIILTAVGSFGDALAPGVVTLIVFRFITGIGVGADLNLVSTYLSELAPPKRRGRIALYTFFVGILGQAVTPFVALALVPNFEIGWRLLFAIGGLIAVAGLILRLGLPESPRWAIGHGKYEDAEATIKKMEKNCQTRHIELPEPRPSQVDKGGDFPLRYLLQARYLRRLAVFVPMWFLWYIGNYGFLGDAAQLISNHGAPVSDSILFLAVGAIGYPVGTLVMLKVVDVIERKLLILFSTIVWLIGMLMIASYANTTLIYIGTFCASLALGAYLQVAYTYTAEAFPTRARSTGFALSDGLGHIGGAVGALVLPMIVVSVSFFAGFTFIGLTGLAAGLIALAGPKATGLDLESVSR